MGRTGIQDLKIEAFFSVTFIFLTEKIETNKNLPCRKIHIDNVCLKSSLLTLQHVTIIILIRTNVDTQELFHSF